MPGTVFVVALVALIVALLSSCAPATSHEPAGGGHRSTGTQLRTFRPYDSHGRLIVRPADVSSGRCFTVSVAAPSSRAYRCFSGNQILDPCVSPPATGDTTPVEVACRSTPWSGVTVLHLRSSLPTATAAAQHGRPWALELVNGVRCVASTGTVAMVAQVALPYGCTNGAVVAIHDPQARTVTVDYGRPGGTTLRHYAVRTMWRS